MQMALVQWPYSGRGCARCDDRASTCCSAASGDRCSGASSKRRLRSRALSRRASSSDRVRLLEGTRLRRRQRFEVEVLHRVARGVVQRADEPGVVRGCRCRVGARPSRTSGRLAMSANSRALAPPRRPPQAPQSCADSCGLLRLVEPWPSTTTIGAKLLDQPEVGQHRRHSVDRFVQREAHRLAAVRDSARASATRMVDSRVMGSGASRDISRSPTRTEVRGAITRATASWQPRQGPSRNDMPAPPLSVRDAAAARRSQPCQRSRKRRRSACQPSSV